MSNGIGYGNHPAQEFNASHSVIAHNVITRFASSDISMVNGSPDRDIRMHDNHIEDVQEGLTLGGGAASLGCVADIFVEANTITRNTISNSGLADAASPDVSSGIVL